MTDRYVIASRDWQRRLHDPVWPHDRRYAVLDTLIPNAAVLETNDLGRALQVRDELNGVAS